MGHILLGIFIGATLIYYFSNRIFRHGVNCILLFFFRIPVKIFEFIDEKTCYPTEGHQTPNSRMVSPITIEKQRAPKPQPQKVQPVDELPDDEISSEDFAEWLNNNPSINVSAKGKPLTG